MVQLVSKCLSKTAVVGVHTDASMVVYQGRVYVDNGDDMFVESELNYEDVGDDNSVFYLRHCQEIEMLWTETVITRYGREDGRNGFS